MNVKTKKQENKETAVSELKVTRAHQFDDGNITFDLQVNGVTIYGCKIAEGKNGQFVSFPSRKGKDGKYYSYAYIALSEDDQKVIFEQIEKL